MFSEDEAIGTNPLQAEDRDRELFDELLAGFVPPNAFDAHAHFFRGDTLGGGGSALMRRCPAESGWDFYSKSLASWMGNSGPTGGLFFPYPAKGLDLAAANRFVAAETAPRPGSRALLMVRPGEDRNKIAAELEQSDFAGFKVYHAFAAGPNTLGASPEEYLPEFLWELAQRDGLLIMLHLVRSRALLDLANADYVRTRCLRYPRARLILAHAARGFCARHTVEGIHRLRGLANVYFDTSGICESGALEAILRCFGPRRIFYGSDFPVSNMRGRCVSVGDSFIWMDEANPDWSRSPIPAWPTLIGIESLFALRQACQTLHLGDADVELIFGGAARPLLGLDGSAHSVSGQEIYRLARAIIPGGTQLLSKRPEMFAPGRWPPYFSEARGVEVVDVGGRRFIDMTTAGIGACLLGYADPDVNAAVIRRVMLGSASTLNCPEELELARLLLTIHPWAEMVRYARSGGEAMAIAVRIARARTGRDVVAICGYHGWQDWYLAANLSTRCGQDPLGEHLLQGLDPAGVPAGLAGTVLPFPYNRIDTLKEIVREHGSRLAAVVMEPTRHFEPSPGFLEGVRDLAKSCGAVLVFDEISSGWRLHLGGVHLRYGVSPDICVFGKALGNGVPISAILGRAEAMQAAEGSFISSTMWTEGLGPAAAIATIRKMQQTDVPGHAARIGVQAREGLQSLAARHRVPLKIGGHPALTFLRFDHPANLALQTLVTVRMLDRGFLSAAALYPTLAHEGHHVAAYLEAMDEVLKEVSLSISMGDPESRIGSPVRHSGFSRLA